MRSPVYWHPAIYQFIMRMLYGKHYESRYTAIAKIIPDGSVVTEVCAGHGYLYSNHLKKKNIKYLGLDINPVFVSHAQKEGIPFQMHDLIADAIPASAYIVIQGSLCQFIPGEETIMRKLLAATGTALIIAEPVRNLSSSSNPLIAFIAKRSANAGKGHNTQRFNEKTLLDFFKKYKEFSEVQEIDGGRELIGVFRK